MKNLKELILGTDNTMQDAIKNLENSRMKIVLVEKNKKFVGIVTDGDIRRGILQGFSQKTPIKKILNKKAIVCNSSYSQEELKNIMIKNGINSIPIVNKNKKIIDVKFLFENEIEKNHITNYMVIMAGGKGERLMPLTKYLPKTLLKVSGKPIAQHIIQRAKNNGYGNFIISINHLGRLIKKKIGNGKSLSVKIKYIKENKKLGTAGSLSLMKKILKNNFVVTNGDVITNINYNDLLKFHIENNAIATMAIRSYEIKNPFGEIRTIGNEIVDYFEKPVYKSYVNTGIYAFHPRILKLMKYNKEISMIQLFKKIKQKKFKVLAYPIHERWIDIGTPENFFSAEKFVNE
jgi:dTDP-glucose pyrophosphorylase